VKVLVVVKLCCLAEPCTATQALDQLFQLACQGFEQARKYFANWLLLFLFLFIYSTSRRDFCGVPSG